MAGSQWRCFKTQSNVISVSKYILWHISQPWVRLVTSSWRSGVCVSHGKSFLQAVKLEMTPLESCVLQRHAIYDRLDKSQKMEHWILMPHMHLFSSCFLSACSVCGYSQYLDVSRTEVRRVHLPQLDQCTGLGCGHVLHAFCPLLCPVQVLQRFRNIQRGLYSNKLSIFFSITLIIQEFGDVRDQLTSMVSTGLKKTNQ